MPNPNQVQGALPRDENNNEIQITPVFQTSDNTPQQSPITLGGSGLATIKVPAGAVAFIVMPFTNNLIVAETLALATAGEGDITTTGSKEQYPCALMQSIFLKGTSGDVVYFRFEMLSTQ